VQAYCIGTREQLPQETITEASQQGEEERAGGGGGNQPNLHLVSPSINHFIGGHSIRYSCLESDIRSYIGLTFFLTDICPCL
jgi:hypothetical protein